MYFFNINGDYHIATALPAPPRHPKPEDVPLLYRYAAEGIRIKMEWHNRSQEYSAIWNGDSLTGWWDMGDCESLNISDMSEGLTASPIDTPKITHATDTEGNRVAVAIREVVWNKQTLEEKAWSLYCEETAGDMEVRDNWAELPKRVQEHYLNRVRIKITKDNIYAAIEYRERLTVAMEVIANEEEFSRISEELVGAIYKHYNALGQAIAEYDGEK
jgi:hypothetical protein